MELHQQNKINFLGKRYQYNQFNGIFFQLKDKLLDNKKIQILREELQPLLSKTKLNVISEENISVSFISNFDAIFANLGQLFIKDDLQILASLRSPIDYLFSHFVEDYYWRFFADKKRNTFAKFSQNLINNPDESCHKMYFLEQYLSTLDKNFKQITILLFEDIDNDTNHYLTTLSQHLSHPLTIDCLTNKSNITPKNSDGCYSKPITLARIIDYYLIKFPNFVKPFLAKIVNINWVKKQVIFKATWHQYPDIKTKQKLGNLLNINSANINKRLNLDTEKLKKYQYVSNQNNNEN
ncbi:MAG: hypothetical protein FXV80_06080 [Candidatus Thioglobus sp.]|nr:MAG: hypothetical protein FXV80_06080 [Candidatus Thioglobus sp.]